MYQEPKKLAELHPGDRNFFGDFNARNKKKSNLFSLQKWIFDLFFMGIGTGQFFGVSLLVVITSRRPYYTRWYGVTYKPTGAAEGDFLMVNPSISSWSRSSLSIVMSVSSCHNVWKLLKMSHLNCLVLAFSIDYCPIKSDLSGNTVWQQP